MEKHCQEFLGLITAAYSFGMAVSSPLFGLWAKFRNNSEILIASSLVTIIGNVMYGFTESLKKNHISWWWMIVSRLVVGIGGGGMTIAR